ncbi:MAG: hypothetical protein ACHRXM_38190 [Isosphaerales bacterium]
MNTIEFLLAKETDAMNPDQDRMPKRPAVTISYDEARSSALRPERTSEPRTTTYTYDVQQQTPTFTFEHDPQKRVFRLTLPEGKTECFRDNPARYLVVEPDSQNGEFRPATKHGKPTYLYLCREEREEERKA